jgi:biotin carboxyl carrier protein
MNTQEIKEFLRSIKDTDIEEVQYQSGNNSIYLKKTGIEPIMTPIVSDNSIKTKEEEKKQTIIVIKSTMVGTFASAQSNDKPPFVMEGDIVTVRQKIGQIEAMKIIKDVYSNVKGKIIKILVSNGQSVEYGQKLFLIDTSK